jgi:hypothetical protein
LVACRSGIDSNLQHVALVEANIDIHEVREASQEQRR